MKRLKKSCVFLFAMIMMLFPVLTACDSNKEDESQKTSNASVAEQTLKDAYENAIAKKHWTMAQYLKDSSGEYTSSSYTNIDSDGTNIKCEIVDTSSYSKDTLAYFEFKKLASSYERTDFDFTSKTYKKSAISGRSSFAGMSLFFLDFLTVYNEQKQIVEDSKSIYIDDSENFNFLYCSELSQKQYNGYTVVEFTFSNITIVGDGENKSKVMAECKCEFYILDGLCRAIYNTSNVTTKSVADGSSTVVDSSSDKSKIIFSYHNSSQITFDKTGYTEEVDETD